jgi:hypothetical protein
MRSTGNITLVVTVIALAGRSLDANVENVDAAPMVPPTKTEDSLAPTWAGLLWKTQDINRSKTSNRKNRTTHHVKDSQSMCTSKIVRYQ